MISEAIVIKYNVMRYLGLDIGWKSVRAVELSSDHKITNIGKIKIPRPIGKNEDGMYESKIRELLHEKKFSRDNVIINLRGSYILSRTYQLPTANKDDFERWFVDNIESLIPGTPINDVVYDYQLLGSGLVLICFAKVRVVNNAIKILKNCDIIPAAIDASCFALYSAFSNHRWIKQKKDFAIIDVNDFKADFLFVKEGEPFVSTEMKSPADHTKERKNRQNAFVHRLAAELQKNFLFYNDRDNLNVERLIITGDYTKISGLRKTLTHTLKVEVRTDNPFKRHKIDLPAGFKARESQQYVQAFGLALKGLKDGKSINLMPHEAKEIRGFWQFNKRARTIFNKSVFTSGTLIVIFVLLLGVVLKHHREVASEVNELKLKRDELVYINSEERELSSKIFKLRNLGEEQFLWSRILSHLGNSVPAGLYFREITTEFRLVSARTKPEKKRKIVIEGDARNSETVLKFVKNLERHFKEIAVDKIKEESGCEFKISLGL